MLPLRELQLRTYAAIAKGESSRVVAALGNSPTPARVSLQVYANNLRENARKALAASYPVVAQLVGEPCFRNLARMYVSRFPSRSGDLARFGADFRLFLADVYHDTDFMYLSFVAALEWACVESDCAPDADPMDMNELRGVAEEDLPAVRFRLHPTVRLVGSPYCVFTLWHAHQQEAFPHVDLRAPGENVLVYRQAEDVVLEAIDAPTFAFVSALEKNEPVLSAHGAAAAVAETFDPAAALRRLRDAGLLIGFEHQHHGDRTNDPHETH